MLWTYDEAIAHDLEESFHANLDGKQVKVKVIEADKSIDVLSQLYHDGLTFPIVVLTRPTDVDIDTSRTNFTRMHKGVAAVLDPDTNELYYEKAIPISLNYDITILATNTVDRDELTREILFKYVSMYFITMTLPYECKRKVRFGVEIDTSRSVSNSSGTLDYLDVGKLYQSIIPLKCEGCVLVSYTAAKLTRNIHQIDIDEP